MNKEPAAKFPGVSAHTLQRHTAAARIAANYLPGKQGHQAVYDRAELKRCKKELAKVTPYARLAVTPETPGAAEYASTALARIQPKYAEHPAETLEALREALRHAAPPILLSEKLILTPAKAAQLSGLSRGLLQGTISTHRLRGQIPGKGWKVKRADLEAFIQRL